MKKLLAIAVLLTASNTLAVSFRAQPLQGLEVCQSPSANAVIEVDNNPLPADATKVIDDLLVTKLKAYRVFKPCDNYAKPKLFVLVSITLTDGINGAVRGYAVNTQAYSVNYPGISGAPIFWSVMTVGVNSQSPSGLLDTLKSVASNQLDSFAADYAEANP